MNNITSTDRAVWIGLYDDINTWKWSLEDSQYYGEGQAEFRNWGPKDPTNGASDLCAAIGYLTNWYDTPCSVRRTFVCNHGKNICGNICLHGRDCPKWQSKQNLQRCVTDKLYYLYWAPLQEETAN